MKKLLTIPVVILVVGLAMVWWLFQSLTLAEKLGTDYIRNMAIGDCLRVGYEEYANTEAGSKAVTFNKQAYEFCMDEKLKSSVK